MYPILRFAWHYYFSKPELTYVDNVSLKALSINLRVKLSDIDAFLEMNNGRYLTIMDIGRFLLGKYVELPQLLKKKKWGLTVAAVSVRYRYRLRWRNKYTLRTSLLAIDERWFYFKQEFIRNGKVHVMALVRTGVTSSQGIVSSQEALNELGMDPDLYMPSEAERKWLNDWSNADKRHAEFMV